VEIWLGSPSLRTIGELKGHWKELKGLAMAGRVSGGAIHDARVAAICLEHGVRSCGRRIATSAACRGLRFVIRW